MRTHHGWRLKTWTLFCTEGTWPCRPHAYGDYVAYRLNRPPFKVSIFFVSRTRLCRYPWASLRKVRGEAAMIHWTSLDLYPMGCKSNMADEPKSRKKILYPPCYLTKLIPGVVLCCFGVGELNGNKMQKLARPSMKVTRIESIMAVLKPNHIRARKSLHFQMSILLMNNAWFSSSKGTKHCTPLSK